VEQQNERQSHRDLGRRHGENKQKHDLTVRLSPARARSDERQAAGIEHDLNAQEREDQVPPCQESRQPQREQDRRQNQCVLHRYLGHAVPPLA
jgi:HD superfamily phosphohydrolase YqeK